MRADDFIKLKENEDYNAAGYITLCLKGILLKSERANDELWQEFQKTDLSLGNNKDSFEVALWVANYISGGKQ